MGRIPDGEVRGPAGDRGGADGEAGLSADEGGESASMPGPAAIANALFDAVGQVLWVAVWGGTVQEKKLS